MLSSYVFILECLNYFEFLLCDFNMSEKLNYRINNDVRNDNIKEKVSSIDFIDVNRNNFHQVCEDYFIFSLLFFISNLILTIKILYKKNIIKESTNGSLKMRNCNQGEEI